MALQPRHGGGAQVGDAFWPRWHRGEATVHRRCARESAGVRGRRGRRGRLGAVRVVRVSWVSVLGFLVVFSY